jgi:hypothetical protein
MGQGVDFLSGSGGTSVIRRSWLRPAVLVAALTIGAVCATMTGTGEGLTPMAEDEPVKTTSAAAPGEVAALMEAAIAAARAEGIAVPPDLARKTFAATRKLAALARRRNPE